MMGHNSETPEEKRANQAFLQALNRIGDYQSDQAEAMGNIKAEFDRIANFGWTKKHIKYAQALMKDDENKMLSELRMQIRIARLLGHSIGRQAEFFESDRTPIEDRAYEEGWAAGAMRGDMSNPYAPGSATWNRWQQGFNEGTSFINAELAGAMADADNDDGEDGGDEQTDLEDAIASSQSDGDGDADADTDEREASFDRGAPWSDVDTHHDEAQDGTDWSNVETIPQDQAG